jgi:hypothetical protein
MPTGAPTLAVAILVSTSDSATIRHQREEGHDVRAKAIPEQQAEHGTEEDKEGDLISGHEGTA